MRIENHPVISFPESDKVTFSYQGEDVTARKGETIAAALHEAGVVELSRSGDKDRPRGLFCAIGKCSSCLMQVDGIPNVRTCITIAREGMEVEKQEGFPELPRTAKKLKPAELECEAIDFLVVGGGPAGLRAALRAGDGGANVLIVDENPFLGGQLIKQTHKFFGSGDQEAGNRGIEIGEDLVDKVESHPNIESMTETSAVGIYDDTVGLYENRERFWKIKPEKTLIATGATEDMIEFPQNDLPGVYGAGGIQTLMNVYGVKPGDKVLMVGAGNVGLIVSYQLIQAGVDVEALVEIAPKIGGYFVHAAKLRRLGVPILTDHKILTVRGDDRVKGAVAIEIDDSGSEVEGTKKEFDVDVVALAAGLSPSYKLLHHAGCDLAYAPNLGGYVPKHDERMRTSRNDIYVAGDASGIEEATSAMLEGDIVGADVALELGVADEKEEKVVEDSRAELDNLRSGPYYEELRNALKVVEI